MAEEDKVFTSKIKYTGIFTFKDFYKFCHEWLVEETKVTEFEEGKYSEKLVGDKKEIDIEWTCQRKLSDYFKEKIKSKFTIRQLREVKVKKDGAEVDANSGDVELKVDGSLIKDYQGKFEMTGFRKFLRSVYEKYVIHSRLEALQEKVISDCNEYLGQAKAFLDIEGRS